ncbi:hypothetical protein AB3662_17965 [Sorangium cellulosum]|uniref:hypothetical protein n=1 Tax=Sorangium cellulosum TaxID=56 RepID=UPI003D9A1B89
MLPACAADTGDGEASELVEGDGLTELESAEEVVGTSSEAVTSLSFLETCISSQYQFYNDGRIVVWESICETRDHAWKLTAWGPGHCSGDLANCDGSLRCGSC